MERIKLVNRDRQEYNYTRTREEIDQETNNNFEKIEDAINYLIEKVEGITEK